MKVRRSCPNPFWVNHQPAVFVHALFEGHRRRWEIDRHLLLAYCFNEIGYIIPYMIMNSSKVYILPNNCSKMTISAGHRCFMFSLFMCQLDVEVTIDQCIFLLSTGSACSKCCYFWRSRACYKKNNDSIECGTVS